MSTSRVNLLLASLLRRRLVRTLVIAVALLVVGIALTLWIVTRSWFIIAQVRPELERKLGGPVALGDAQYEGDGRFIFRNFTLRAPGHDGPAGEVARIERATIVVDEKKLYSGQIELLDVALRGVVLRFSESMEWPGRFSFLSLQPQWSDEESEDLSEPPRIRIEDATLEIGRHDQNGYTMQAQRRVRGEMTPAVEEGWYNYELTELDDAGDASDDDGIRITGQWNVENHRHWARIRGLQLDERTRMMCPSMVRAHWDRMNLNGSVNDALLEWNSQKQYTIRLSVDDVAMTLPIDLKDLWARYEDGAKRIIDTPPRLHVDEGEIHVSRDALRLADLKGQVIGADEQRDLIPVPYTMSLTMRDLPAIDWQHREQWMSNILEVAPFEMRFALGEFGVHEDITASGRAIELPTLIAEILTRFQMENWRVTTNGIVRRPAPKTDARSRLRAQPIEVEGEAYISADRAVYDKFAYPLDDVAVGLRFDNEGLFIDGFRGRGSGDTVVRMAGRVSLPGRGGDADVSLTAENAPIDSRFRSALDGGNGKLFDMLLDETAYCRLVRSGLLTLPDDEQSLIDCVQDVEPRDASPADGAPRPTPFQFGGTVDVDLHIKRDPGEDQPVYLAGDIHIDEIGVVAAPFPYPVTVTDGTLRVQRDRVQLVARSDDSDVKGLTVETPGGGRGVLGGELLIERSDGKQSMTPDLHLRVRNDPVGELLYAAIPDASEPVDAKLDSIDQADADRADGLTPTGRMVRSLQLNGRLQWDARFTADKNRPFGYLFEVALADATAHPGTELADAVGAAGLVWPQGLTVENVHGILRVQPGEARLEQLAGRVFDSHIAATAHMDWGTPSPQTRVDVQLENLPFGPYLINLLPQKRREAVRSFWTRYDPSGSFDAQLAYEIQSGERRPPKLTVFNPNLTFMVNQHASGVNYVDGALHVTSEMVEFDDLRLTVPGTDTEPTDGMLVFDGRYGTSDELDGLSVTIDWLDGRFTSPLIPELLRLLGNEGHARNYREHRPRGVFHATLRYESGRANEKERYALTLRPQVFSMNVDEKTLSVELDEPSRLVFSPGRIKLDQLTGSLPGGRFAVDGMVRVEESLQIETRVNYDGTLTSDSFLALMPAPVRETIHDLSLKENEPSVLRNARFHVRRIPSAEGDEPVWETDFNGTIRLRNASFDAGIPVEEFRGDIDMSVLHRSGEAPAGRLNVHAQRLRAAGQRLRNLVAEVSLDNEASLVRMRTFRADAHGGAVTIEAQAGLGDRAAYDAQVNLAGVSLAGFVGDFNRAAMQAAKVADDQDNTSTANTEPPDGRLYASLQISGERGRPDTRVGRGSARVVHGRMAASPVMLRLLQISELMLPIAGSLETASFDFFLHGEQIVFEDILFECATLDLHGDGVMNYRTNAINLRFGRRGTLVVVGDIVGEISDALFLVEVTGTLADPVTRIVPLPALSRSEQDGGLPTIRRAAVSESEAGEP